MGIYSAGLFVGSGLSLLIGGSVVEAWNRAWPTDAPLGLAGWQAAFLVVGIPGLLMALWVATLREPPRGALDGLPTPPAERPFADFLAQLGELIPPFTAISAVRRGAGALVGNLMGAAAIAVVGGLLAWLTGSAEQFVFLAVGFYAVFSWACALRARDPETFSATWKSSAFMAIVIAYGMICFLGYSVSYWAAPYAERTFALGKAELGLAIGAPNALGGFLGVIFGGRLADVLHRRHAGGRAMVLLIALLGAVPTILVGYSTGDATVFLVCNFLVQFATSSALGAAAAASQSLVLPRMRGVATAIFFLGTTLLGLALGPFMAGFVSETTGSLATGVIATLVVVPIGLAAVAVAVRRMPGVLSSA
jgi:MFS family permease